MTPTTRRASGPFTVALQPQAESGFAAPALGRLLLNKQYHGDLQASAQGQMLSAMTAMQGSAGYVAIEQVSGSLHGRDGGFVLQHSGLMDRGAPQLVVTVVPDSATGELTGLTGRLHIRIEDGAHFYDFDYSLPAA